MARLLFSLALLFAGSVSAAIPAAPDRTEGEGPYPQLILRGATVITGTGAPAYGPVDIVIEGERIVAVSIVGSANSPIDPKNRNPRLGAMAPIAVVNTVFSAGDGNRGVQTAAFNLPNDERVIREKGSKRVMLKNNQQAKFDKVLVPISKVALAAADQGNVAFDAFFTHILMHELMHGLDPHDISVNGKMTTVRQELKETYSAIEEAKADISGLFALQYLVDKGQLDKSLERTMYTTFLASAFRSLRFGINEAHGRGQAIQLNYLLDKGAFRVNADGTFSVDAAKMREGVTALTGEIMTLQAEGSYAKAKQMIDTLGVLRPPTKAVLDKLTSVPVDIEPRFVTAIDLLK